MLPHLNDIITIRHNRTKFLQFLKKNHNEENRNILFNFSFYPNGKSNGTKFHGIEEDFCWTFLDSLGIKHRKYRYQQFLVEVDCVKNWGVCACYQILCKRLLYWMCILEDWNYLWRRCNNNFWDMWYELHDTVCLLHLHFVHYSTKLQIFPRII